MNVVHRLHSIADAYPQKTAVASVDGELTYEGLYERVDRYAAALTALGVEPDDQFNLLMGNSNRMLSLLIAGWQIGAIPAPINTRLGADDVGGLIADAGSSVVVVDETLGDIADAVESIETVSVYRSGDRAADADTDGGSFESHLPDGRWKRTVTPRLDREDAVFLHTAGTTGRPKWVRLNHGNLAGSLGPMVGANLGAEDIGLHYYPLYHSGGIDMTLCRLLVGATTVIGRGWDPEDALRNIEQYEADGITIVPQMGYELAHHDAVSEYDLSSLSYFLVGSDTVTEELAGEFRRLGAQPMQAYGLTETMAVVAITAFGDEDCPLDSTGEVIEDVARIEIIDPDTGESVEAGEIGEILVTGDKLAAGYHERPEKEAEVFEGVPASGGSGDTEVGSSSGRWLHTEDLGTFDEDGYLYITGRLDDMMIVGGENVYPTDVEETLAGHPAISQVVVVSVPDERKGEIPVANVVLEPGAELTDDELKEWFVERDAAFKHPRVVRFLEEIPKTALGKIDRAELQEEVAADVHQNG